MMPLLDALSLSYSPAETQSHKSTEYLQVSPYIEEPHLLDLRPLSLPQQLLAKALVHLRPMRDDYATAQYRDTFNWTEIVQTVKRLSNLLGYVWAKRSFYIVVFRSQILGTTDRAHLGALDKRSHAEAMASGGLLKYWFGTPDSSGRNLATCRGDSVFPFTFFLANQGRYMGKA